MTHWTKGNFPAASNVDRLAALQEDSLRAGKLLPDANQILALELKIEIARETVGENVIGRLVAFEPTAAGLGKVNGHGEREQQNAEQGRREDAWFRGQVNNLLTALDHVICETCSSPA